MMLWRTFQVSGFTVHLKYTTVPILILRKKDFPIMEYAMRKGASKEELLSTSRVSGLACAIGVSDIVTSDSKHLEEFATARTLSREHTSKYKCPKETPA
jgi:hypothetical protein